MYNNAPHNLLIVYYDLGVGGVQRKIVDIIHELSILPKYRNTHICLLLTDKRHVLLLPQITNPKITVRYKPFFRMPLWPLIFFYTLRYQAETIVAFLPVPALQTATALRLLFWRKIRFVISEDVITSHAFGRNDFSNNVNNALPAVFRRADAVLVPSSPIAADLVSRYYVPKNRIVLAQNWVRPPKHLPHPHKTVDCLYMGRFDKEKRIPFLISALGTVCKTIPNISLRLVGEGRESKSIATAIARSDLVGRVTISEPCADVWNILTSAKLALLASDSEGAPMFLLEAMAAGLPAVVMHFPGIEDILINGVSGIICQNKSEYVAAIIKLLNNPKLRDSMGDYAKKISRQRYSSEHIRIYLSHLFPDNP